MVPRNLIDRVTVVDMKVTRAPQNKVDMHPSVLFGFKITSSESSSFSVAFSQEY